MSICRPNGKNVVVCFVAASVLVIIWTYNIQDNGLLEEGGVYKNKRLSGIKPASYDTGGCDGVPQRQTISCWTVYRFMQNLELICRKHRVIWFVWGDFAMMILNGCFLHDASFQLAAEKESNIQRVWEELSNVQNYSCNHGNDNQPFSCTFPLAGGGTVVFRIHGPAIIDYGKRELAMAEKYLWRRHVFKLDRFLPIKYANYYGIKVPIPSDPLFVFSHIVPSSQSKSSTGLKYVYGQGCKQLLTARIGKCAPNHMAGKAANVTFQGLCNPTLPHEVYVPLHILVNNTAAAADLRLEDFEDVVPLEHGDGQYVLKNPHAKSWAQYGQDLYLDKYFKNRTNGFFFEVGGYDGQSMSNTLYFEKYRNWDGILVEAVPYLYSLIQSRKRNCYMLNACVSDSLKRQTFVLKKEDESSGLTASEDVMTDVQYRRYIGKQNKDTLVKVTVNCKPMITIMNAIGVHKIDLFSLDVEGAELLILKSIPWDKLDIDVFLIETFQFRDEIIKYMTEKGYEQVAKLEYDDLFQKKR